MPMSVFTLEISRPTLGVLYSFPPQHVQQDVITAKKGIIQASGCEWNSCEAHDNIKEERHITRCKEMVSRVASENKLMADLHAAERDSWQACCSLCVPTVLATPDAAPLPPCRFAFL
jgi:hypothetical protein